MSKEKKVKRSCNQCGHQLAPWITSCGLFFVCVNPACPSYSLLQIPLEQMPKEKK